MREIVKGKSCSFSSVSGSSGSGGGGGGSGGGGVVMVVSRCLIEKLRERKFH